MMDIIDMNKKELTSELRLNEKEEIVDFILSYKAIPYLGFSFNSIELLNIKNTLESKYLFKESPSEDSFECLAIKISMQLGSGPSMTREMIDLIDFAPAAGTGALYGGLIGAVGGALAVAIGGDSIIHAVGYSLLGAFLGGGYNFYSEKNLKLNAVFDEVLCKCFSDANTEEINDLLTYYGSKRMGEVGDTAMDFEF